MKALIFFLLSLAIFTLAQDLYDDKSDVIHLTQSTFDSQVTNTNDFWLVEFYGNFEPIIEQN